MGGKERQGERKVERGKEKDGRGEVGGRTKRNG